MSKSTVRNFAVATTKGIAYEMFRYDGAKVVGEEPVSCDPKWVDPLLVDAYTIWLFVFEMDKDPTYERWATFGISQSDIHEH